MSCLRDYSFEINNLQGHWLDLANLEIAAAET